MWETKLHFHMKAGRVMCVSNTCVVNVTSSLTMLILKLISGFHGASFLSVTFINQLMHSIITVTDLKILLYKSLKDTLKITPTCFGSHRIHHQGVITCTWLKLHIMVQMCLLCAWSVFGGIFWTCGVCVRCVGLRTAVSTHNGLWRREKKNADTGTLCLL